MSEFPMSKSVFFLFSIWKHCLVGGISPRSGTVYPFCLRVLFYQCQKCTCTGIVRFLKRHYDTSRNWERTNQMWIRIRILPFRIFFSLRNWYRSGDTLTETANVLLQSFFLSLIFLPCSPHHPLDNWTKWRIKIFVIPHNCPIRIVIMAVWPPFVILDVKFQTKGAK